jgi:hypothetical protein
MGPPDAYSPGDVAMDSRSTRTLKVHEITTAAGGLSEVLLRFEAGLLALVTSEETLELPEGALDAAMARFGAPFETAERVAVVGVLDLGEGRALRHVRHLAVYDVIARDFLVYDVPGRDPMVALATTVAGALDRLGRAARRSGGSA